MLVHVLDSSMRLLHPICPFQSEEIWQRLPGNDERWQKQGVRFCAVAPYPTPDDALLDEGAERGISLLMSAVTMARNARQESGLGAQKKVPAIYLSDDEQDRALLLRHKDDLVRLASLESLEVEARAGYAPPKLCATNADARLEVVVPLEGLLDVDAEKKRLEKEIEKAAKEALSLEKRLSNKSFVEKAPPEVVEKGKQDLEAATARVSRLQQALARLS